MCIRDSSGHDGVEAQKAVGHERSHFPRRQAMLDPVPVHTSSLADAPLEDHDVDAIRRREALTPGLNPVSV